MNLPSSVWSSFPVAMSKMLMIPSMAPLAKYFPSGLWRAKQLRKRKFTNVANQASQQPRDKGLRFRSIRVKDKADVSAYKTPSWRSHRQNNNPWFLTYAILRMNFPRVSRENSFLPLSTPKMLTLPRWLPVAMYLESGEKATVHASTRRQRENVFLKSHIKESVSRVN